MTRVECASNGGSGARISGPTAVQDSDFKDNLVHGLAVSGFPGTQASVSVKGSSSHRNGGRGFNLQGITGGSVQQCTASGNVESGIYVGTSGIPGDPVSSGVKIDECYATHNLDGIVVEGENFLLRSAGAHNTGSNMLVGPLVFTGPSVASPAWTEAKPYAWP